ncbi:MAG: hypothetical protein QM775_14170 [Pirellulales bacterium]
MQSFTLIRRAACAAVLSSLVVLLPQAQAAKVWDQPQRGKVELKSVDVLGFAPDGVLLVGDGRSAAIFAVKTGDVKAGGKVPATIAKIDAKLAAAVGAKPDGIEIADLAVNPASGTTYFAVRKQDDKTPIVLTLNSAGDVGLVSLDDVEYVRVALPTDGAPITRITDVAWTDGKLLAAAAASEEFASKIFIAPTPLKHDAVGELHSAETYHVQHHKWETKSPMTTIMPFTEGGKTYLAGAFACTPVVKYSLDSLVPAAKVKGTSVLELGSGNRPQDMFTYTKGGKEFVLANTFRFHHARKPLGPSPYWTVRFDRGLLGEEENVNEKALFRLQGDKPASERVVMIDAYHGVVQMDRLGETEAVVLRQNPDNSYDLAVLELP